MYGKKGYWVLMLALAVFSGCSLKVTDPGTGTAIQTPDEVIVTQVLSVKLVTPPLEPFESWGDIWRSTWADDDNLYVSWGDGCGPGQTWGAQYFNFFSTDAGVAVLEGTLPNITNCGSPFTCVKSIHVPDSVGWVSELENDKPSSLLYCNNRLFFAGHKPFGDPDSGYIAYSEDYGTTWTTVPNTPWTKANDSRFRVLMYINMGKNYELNTDGYVYAFGMGKEWDWFEHTVYLCRVPKPQIADYSQYTYLAGWTDMEEPLWTGDQSAALPLDGMYTETMGSAMYHAGAQHYLFISGEGFRAAQKPWGPWYSVEYLDSEYNSSWEDGYMPALIPKDAGPDDFYFAKAGSETTLGYNFHLGKAVLQLEQIEVPVTGDQIHARHE